MKPGYAKHSIVSVVRMLDCGKVLAVSSNRAHNQYQFDPSSKILGVSPVLAGKIMGWSMANRKSEIVSTSRVLPG